MAKPMPITGSVLAWALADKGLTLAQAAESLKLDQELIQSWVDEDAKPNKGQFERLVKLLDCNESLLFLPKPPQSSRQSNVQFRRHADAPNRIPDETASAMRAAQIVLKVAKWLAVKAEEEDADWPVVPLATVKEDPESVALRLRAWLDWSAEKHSGPNATDSSAAKAMRSALQNNRIVVLHLTMDEGVTRGFSLHDGPASVIAVNTRDHIRARYFSYAHELAHLALRDDSVCLTRNDSSNTERFCNRVAGAILMPADAFRSFVNDRFKGHVSTRDQVITIRNYFKVSLQAAAIRAENLGLASETLYAQVVPDPEPKSSGGTYIPGNERTRPRVRVDQYGSGFVNSLVEAEESGYLKRTQVLDLLHLSDRELDRARELASSGVG
ncbi:ImmA/IrrE family metallo-endopeptidase [Mycolicibacterium sp. CBM1]